MRRPSFLGWSCLNDGRLGLPVFLTTTATCLRRRSRGRPFLMNATTGMSESYDPFLVIQNHRKAGEGAYVAITNRTRDRLGIHELALCPLARHCTRLCHG